MHCHKRIRKQHMPHQTPRQPAAKNMRQKKAHLAMRPSFAAQAGKQDQKP
jgi:hypothetical protein